MYLVWFYWVCIYSFIVSSCWGLNCSFSAPFIMPYDLLMRVLMSYQRVLMSRYRQHVEAAIEYVRTIDDFADLVDPRTLALHCLGPEPFAYVLHTIKIEEKKSKCLLSSSLPLFLFFLTSVFLSQRWLPNLTRGCMQRWGPRRISPFPTSRRG